MVLHSVTDAYNDKLLCASIQAQMHTHKHTHTHTHTYMCMHTHSHIYVHMQEIENIKSWLYASDL